ncbi:MAG: CCA tRNA nucleotidyltransferase [Planctomycetes bacterium]|nr:CCA tRNA nucleotidyltransferase [Planctomycetota bacterium]
MIQRRVFPESFVKNDAGRCACGIVERLRAAGFESWLAGGCVRDASLGIVASEFDVATSALPAQVMRIFDKVVETGVRYGTVTVLEGDCKVEVTTFRAEGEYRDARHPGSLVFGVSAEEDAKRRDFTINALFGDPVENCVIDYVGGLSDLDARLLRTVGVPGDRFEEDALRLLRGVRFAARFNLTIERDTESAMRMRPHLLRKLSAERVGAELIKMLTGPHPGAALRMLEQFQFVDEFLPEAGAMRGVPQPAKFHPEGNVWVHTVDVVERIEPKTPVLVLSALFHDVGKVRTLTWSDRIRFHGHEPVSCEISDARMRQLRYSNDIIDEVHDLVAEHIHIGGFQKWRRAKQLRFLAKANIDDHLSLHLADCSSSHGALENYHYMKAELQKLRDHPPQAVRRLLLDGRDLLNAGYRQGPNFKTMLEALRDAELEEKIATREEALAFLAKNFPVSG